MESNSDLRSALNELIRVCRDGQEGFRTAAEHLESGEVQHILNEYSLQRAKFTGALQSAAHELGDSNPENASSVSGTLHRGWINLKFVVGGRNRQAILGECVRGEQSALAEYQKALAREIPAPIREMVQEQYLEIQAAHDRVKGLWAADAPT